MGAGVRRRAAFALWAVCVGAAALLAARPGDPGPVPAGRLVVLGVLGVLAARGSRTAWAALTALDALLLATFFLLAWPIAPQLWAFYGLVALGLAALVAAGTATRPGQDGGGSPGEWRVITPVMSSSQRRTTDSSSSL